MSLDLNNILQMLQAAGNKPQAASGNGMSGSADFFNLILQQIGQGNIDLSQLKDGVTLKDLQAKISGLLQSGAPLTPENLKAAISPLIRGGQNTATTSPFDSLTSLTDHPSSAAPDNAAQSDKDLAELLNQLTPGNKTKNSEALAQLMAQLQPAAGEATAFSPEIIELIQQKIAGLQAGTLSENQLVQLQTNLAATLQHQGFDQATIDKHVDLMTRFLTGGDVTQAEQQLLLPEQATAQNNTKSANNNNAPAESDTLPVSFAASQTNLSAGHNATVEEHAAQQQKPATQPHAQMTAKPEQSAQNNIAASAQQGQQTGQQQAANGLKTTASALPHSASQMFMQMADSGLNFDFGNQFQGSSNPFGHNLSEGGVYIKTDGAGASSFAQHMAGRHANPTTQMVGMQLTRNATAKVETMTIQLDPADLGRLEIQMKFDKDGGLKTHLLVDKPETLAMLQRDASHLERVLQQAGFDTDKSNLSFDLREQAQDNASGDTNENQQNGTQGELAENADDVQTMSALLALQETGYATATGVNILV